MILKGIIDTDTINYKKISMVLEFPICKGFKCDKECGQQVCQNSALATAPNIEIEPIDLINRYLNNPITQAVCMQGLECMDSFSKQKDSTRIYGIILHSWLCRFYANLI